MTIEEQFARAQFEEMSDSKKLSLPSFERMPGGLTTRSSAEARALGSVEGECVMYESILIQSDRTSSDPQVGASSWEEVRFLMAGNAVARAARGRAHARFAPRESGLVGTKSEKYTIVNAETLEPVALDARVDAPRDRLTRMQADQALAEQIGFHPDQASSLLVVPEYEVEGVS